MYCLSILDVGKILHPVKELSITLKENETVPSAVVSRTKSSMRISIWDGGILGLRKKLGFEISWGGGGGRGGLVYIRLEMD